MFSTDNIEGLPFLSILIFAPLIAAAFATFLSDDRLVRWWALGMTTAVAIFSANLYIRFDSSTAVFQFVETHSWIPALKINYTLGIDGISLLLVLLTTLITPQNCTLEMSGWLWCSPTVGRPWFENVPSYLAGEIV